MVAFAREDLREYLSSGHSIDYACSVLGGVQTSGAKARNLITERNFKRCYRKYAIKEITMYETTTKPVSGHTPRSTGADAAATHHAPRSTSADDAAVRRPATDPKTDPKFVRESFTMRRMLPWQIAALAAAALLVGLAVFFI